MIEKLTEIVREQTGNEDIVLTSETNLLTDLGLNSFDLVNMVVEVEDEFDLKGISMLSHIRCGGCIHMDPYVISIFRREMDRRMIDG